MGNHHAGKPSGEKKKVQQTLDSGRVLFPQFAMFDAV